MEVWKDISGFEGSYQVSEYGRVRSLDRLSANGRKLKGKVLKPGRNPFGYMTATLWAKEPTVKLIHELVAEAFLESSLDVCCVRHGPNGVRDNSVTNLYWPT